MPAHHTNTIVVDFDDTIALTLNRDWENAKPNSLLIDKLNVLFDQQWDIHIVTARGQLSCNGDHAAADVKYRPQIEKWLRDHGVKYTSLSFQKKLAAYYIDDKGITPEAFVQSFSRIPLKSGLSGAKVFYDEVNSCVYKTASNTANVIKWFDHIKKTDIISYTLRLPEIYTVIGDTIKMEYIQFDNKESRIVIPFIVDILNRFAENESISRAIEQSYIDRVTKRMKDVLDAKAYSDLEVIMQGAMNLTPASFGHGDLSYENVLWSTEQNDCNVYLIDPIYEPDLYSSWIIDSAKYVITLELAGLQKKAEELRSMLGLGFVLRAHELGHLCRMYPYSNNKLGLLTEIYHLIHVLR
jgi:capsule biosynthesis phosphatase